MAKFHDQIAFIAYGNHPKSAGYREDAVEVIDVLRAEEQVEKRELMEHIGLDPDSENDDQKFDRLLRPLRGNNALDIVFIDSRTVQGDTHYFLTRSAFDATVRNVVQNVRYAIDSKPHEEIKRLRERVRELEEENERLRE